MDGVYYAVLKKGVLKFSRHQKFSDIENFHLLLKNRFRKQIERNSRRLNKKGKFYNSRRYFGRMAPSVAIDNGFFISTTCYARGSNSGNSLLILKVDNNGDIEWSKETLVRKKDKHMVIVFNKEEKLNVLSTFNGKLTQSVFDEDGNMDDFNTSFTNEENDSFYIQQLVSWTDTKALVIGSNDLETNWLYTLGLK